MKRTIGAAGFLTALGLAALFTGGHNPKGSATAGFGEAWPSNGGFETGPGHVATPDTFRLLVRDANFPQGDAGSAALAAGLTLAESQYDTILEDTDGSHLRYAGIRMTDADTTYWTAGYSVKSRALREYDVTPTTSNAYKMFFWFDTSAIPAGYKIESAKFIVSPQKWQTLSADGPDTVFRARIDTVAGDYTMVSTASPNSDPHFMDISWNSVDNTFGAHVAWSPTLASRDDWCDFGPRSADLAGPVSVAEDSALGIDVTDALQQVVDRGLQGRGVIVVPYKINTTASEFHDLILATVTSASNLGGTTAGNPALSVVATSRRGAKPWATGQLPVTIVWDMNKPADPYIAALWDSMDWAFSAASCYSTWDTPDDSLWVAKGGVRYDMIQHTRDHITTGNISDHEIDYQIARVWMDSFITNPPDTNTIDDFAYAVGTGPPVYSFNAIGRLVANGYRNARMATTSTTTPIGAASYPAWDDFVNMFGIAGVFAENLFNPAEATMTDQFGDYVDTFYSDHRMSALVLYAHGFDDNTTPQPLHWFCGLVEANPMVEYRGYDWIMDKLQSRAFVDPADVSVVNGASEDMATSAAKYDSLANADGVTWTDSVWVGPASN